MFRLTYTRSQAFLSITALLLLSVSSASPASAQQVINGVQVFPANNVWNTKINGLPVDANSATYVNTLGPTKNFHPDWGSNPAYGIPYNLVPADMAKVNVIFDYADESDVGPYPVNKKTSLIEGNSWKKTNSGDRHVLMIDSSTKTLYELFYANAKGKKITAGSGAIFNLNSNALRPDGWTSADAAGLPIFPGLINYDEAASGVIKHALRCTTQRTNGYIWPARHLAGSQTAGWPPMGQRFRLKASFDISSFSTINKAILTCLKEYGMIVADNGSSWYVTGTSDPRWNDDELNQLKTLHGSDFEAVNESSLIVNPDSGQAQ
ncbi:MAG: hypothetical protein K2X93_03685 [Candidatus Obscuribacterales bacterium]|nr:hypothetical protein [Candidatus Obscuribacterales bacterium]